MVQSSHLFLHRSRQNENNSRHLGDCRQLTTHLSVVFLNTAELALKPFIRLMLNKGITKETLRKGKMPCSQVPLLLSKKNPDAWINLILFALNIWNSAGLNIFCFWAKPLWLWILDKVFHLRTSFLIIFYQAFILLNDLIALISGELW